jgi:hypothetical protein
MRRRVIIPFTLVICFIFLSGCVQDSPPILNQTDPLSQTNDSPVTAIQNTGGKGSQISKVSAQEEFLVTNNSRELYNGYLEATMNPGYGVEPHSYTMNSVAESPIPDPYQESEYVITGSSAALGELTGAPISANGGIPDDIHTASGSGSLIEIPNTNRPAETSGSSTNLPGEYYEGAGSSITPFPTRSASDCGCAN